MLKNEERRISTETMIMITAFKQHFWQYKNNIYFKLLHGTTIIQNNKKNKENFKRRQEALARHWATSGHICC